MQDTQNFQWACIAIGGLHLAAGAWVWAAGERASKAIEAFPRMTWTGRLLSLGAWIWATWYLSGMQLGGLEVHKPRMMFVAGPILFLLILIQMRELLAARAAGGLLLLAALPVMKAAQWLDTGWRFIPITYAYVWVVAGMAWVLGPYRLRRWLCPLVKENRARHITMASLLAIGGLFLGIGLLAV